MARPPFANIALVVPLLLVNSVALYGQAQWGYDNLARNWVVAVGFALAIESIGVYLAAEAHRALLAGDASLRLRLGSYGVGGLAGALNYAHFHPQMTQAIVFGVLSAISPVLWAIRSRSISRDHLRKLQLIDGRAVKFTAAQWLLFPRQSFRAFKAAVWAGETNPTLARALVAQEAPVRLARLTVVYLPGTFRPEPSAWFRDLGRVAAAAEPRRKEVTERTKPVAITAGRQRLRPDQHPLWPDWLDAYRSGKPWSDFEFAQMLGEGVTIAAARSRRQRWEQAAAQASMV
jgi:hypothetical protein